MSNQKIKFGNDGWRALLDEVFTEENLSHVAQAFALYLTSNALHEKPVAIGFDGRKNSKQSAELFASILSGNNIAVLLSDVIIPTPVLSYSVVQNNCAAGIMITASHNPSNYNGVKFKGAYGGPFLVEETRNVEALLNNVTEIPHSTKHITVKNFLPEYVEHLKTVVDFGLLKAYAQNPKNNPSVLIDSMGGAGKTILEDILVELGWRAQTIFGTPEASFYDRNPEPIEKNLEALQYNTSVTDALLGIATDGDADRCSIVYENGKWMTAQETILALLWHLHTYKQWRGCIITSVSVTDKVRLLAERWGEKIFAANVGFGHITEIMLKEQFLFGAEESGGFGFQNHLPERDGILSGLLMCELIVLSGKSLQEIMDEIYAVVGKLFYVRKDFSCEQNSWAKISQRLISKEEKTIAHFPVLSKQIYKEGERSVGVKYFFGDSHWLLFRASQTEQLIRMYAEGTSQEDVVALLREGEILLNMK